MKRKELFWIIPLLVMVCFIMLLRVYVAKEQKRSEYLEAPLQNGFTENRPRRVRIVPHLQVEKVEKRPVSLRAAYEGWDMRIVVTLNYKGAEPKWWKTAGQLDISNWKSGIAFYYGKKAGSSLKTSMVRFYPKLNVVQSGFQTPQRNAATNKYEAGILMRLEDLPRSAQSVVLRVPAPPVQVRPVSSPSRGGVVGGVSSSGPTPTGAPNPYECIVDTPVIFTVRGPHEVIKAPNVSHDSGAEVTGAEIPKRINPNPNFTSPFTEVHLHFLEKPVAGHDNNRFTNSFPFSRSEVVNEQGKRLPEATVSLHPKKAKRAHGWESTFLVDMTKIPANERGLTLKSIYLPGNAWPLEIRLPLRRDGKDIIGTLSKSQIQTAPYKFN